MYNTFSPLYSLNLAYNLHLQKSRITCLDALVRHNTVMFIHATNKEKYIRPSPLFVFNIHS